MNDSLTNLNGNSPRTILIVEDENIVALDLRSILTYLGYSVIGITGYAEEALTLVRSLKPDAVMMDIGLRGTMDGIEAAQIIRHEMNTPVVFITANADAATLNRAKITEPYGFILKPFDEREIQTTLEMAFFRYKTDQELRESQQWLATTLQSIGDAVIATDEHGNIKFMNPIAENLTGWTQQDAIGKPLPDVFIIVNESTRKIVSNPVEIVLKEGRIVGLANHTILIAKDGTEYNIDDAAAPIYSKTGEITGVVLTFRNITEKYKIEAALEANEKRFRAFIENSNDMVRMVDANGKILYLSPSVERITGYSLEEAYTQSMLELIHPDDLPTAIEKLANLKENPNNLIHIQHRIRHKNGNWLWIEGTVINLLDDKSIGAIVSNIRDITDRKNAEQALKENHAFLKAVTEGTDDIIFVKDTDGKYLLVNSPAEKISRYTPEQMIGKTDAELFSAETAQASMTTDRSIIESQTSRIVENTVDVAGEQRIFMTSKNPLYDDDGKIIGVIGVSRDITELKNAQNEVRKNEELFRAMIEDSNNGIALLNKEGQLLYSSASNEKILGYSAEERLQQNFLDNIHPDYRDKAREYFQELFTGRRKIANFEIQAKHKDGSWRWLEVSGNNMLDNPTVNAIIVNFHDITRRTVAAEKLMKSEQTLADIVEAITVPMIITSIEENKILYGNQLVADIVGLSLEDLMTQQALNFYVNPEDRESAIQELTEKGFVRTREVQLRRSNHQVFWGLLTARKIHFAGKQAVVTTIYDITERKNAEQALQENYALLQAITEGTKEQIFAKNMYGDYIFINSTAAKTVNRTKEEIIGFDDTAIFSPENAAKIMEVDRIIIQTGKPQIFEDTFQIKGIEHTFIVSKYPLYDAAGIIVGVVGISRDITERKNAEEKLYLYERALQSAGEGILITDATQQDNPIVFANERFYDITGYSPNEIIGINCRFLQGEKTDKNTIAEIKKSMTEYTYFEGEILNYKKDGTPFWNFLRIAPVPNELGIVTHFIGFQNDVTERKLADKVIFNSQMHLKEAQRLAKYGNWNYDCATDTLVWSDELYTVFGIDLGTSIKTHASFINLIDEADRQAVLEANRKAKADGQPFTIVYNITTPSGEKRIIEEFGRGEVDERGNVMRLFGTAQNITERKKAEETVKASEEKYRSLVENTPDIIMTLDRDNNITFINHVLEGFALEDVIGTNSFNFIPAEYYQLAKETYNNVYQTGKTQSYEIAGLGANGSSAWYTTHAIPIFANSEVIGITLVTRDITDRRNAEEELRKSENNLHYIVKAITVPMVVTNIESGRVVYANQLIAEMLNVPMEEVFEQEAKDFYANPDDREVVLNLIKKKGYVQNYLLQMRRKSSEHIWVLFSGTIITFDGEPALVVTMYDVSEQKKSEEALIMSQTRLRGVIESAMDAIITIDSNSTIVLFNKAAEIMFGCSADEAIGTPIDTFVPMRFRTTHSRFIAEFGNSGVTNRAMGHLGILSGLHSNGEEFPIEASISQVDSIAGKLFTVILRDITERRKADEQIKQQADLLEIVPDAIIMRELNGTVIYWNSGAEKMYGWTPQEAIGNSVLELISTGEPADFFQAQKILLENNVWAGEVYQHTKNNKKILVQSRWKLVRTADGTPTSVLVTNTDITEKRNLEQQFLRAQRLESIGTLASGIAHDLNNILTPVVLGMELLKLKLQDEAGKQRIDSIITIVKRGSGLISQVLEFARGTKGDNVPINPKYIVSEILKVIRETFSRDIVINANIAKEDNFILGDGTQLHQVLMNLSINARDAMPNGGKLDIELASVMTDDAIVRQNINAKIGKYVVITVRDTGEGISPENLNKIFDPFFTTKAEGKGTGLGLATVFTIIKNHGGFINVYSEIGRGTAFKVYIPAHISADVPQTEELQPIRNEGNRQLILVVDDEELIRSITSDILIENGYIVLVARNGEEAAEVYQRYKDKISLVLTDIMMPEMNGVELIRIIQSINPNQRIIASSGLMHGSVAAQLAEAKIAAKLAKPYTADELLNAVHQAFLRKL
jgi:PAS domain S-box-containing protein